MKNPFVLYLFVLGLLYFNNLKGFSQEVERESVVDRDSIINQDSLQIKPYQTPLKDYLIGKINYDKDSSFIEVDRQYANKSIFIRKETYAAFLKMRAAAEADSIQLMIVSGGRNFFYQKYIWDQKWKQYSHLEHRERLDKIMEYSLMPMTSRHHWGTEIDLNDLNTPYFESGEGLKIYQWLQKNAAKFGFCQVYTESSYEKYQGVKPEKWHWSYIPLSKPLLESYNRVVKYSDLNGFKGSKLAKDKKVIEQYVNGIEPCPLISPIP